MEYKVMEFYNAECANENLAWAAEEGWTVKTFGTDNQGYYWALLEREVSKKESTGADS